MTGAIVVWGIEGLGKATAGALRARRRPDAPHDPCRLHRQAHPRPACAQLQSNERPPVRVSAANANVRPPGLQVLALTPRLCVRLRRRFGLRCLDGRMNSGSMVFTAPRAWARRMPLLLFAPSLPPPDPPPPPLPLCRCRQRVARRASARRRRGLPVRTRYPLVLRPRAMTCIRSHDAGAARPSQRTDAPQWGWGGTGPASDGRRASTSWRMRGAAVARARRACKPLRPLVCGRRLLAAPARRREPSCRLLAPCRLCTAALGAHKAAAPRGATRTGRLDRLRPRGAPPDRLNKGGSPPCHGGRKQPARRRGTTTYV